MTIHEARRALEQYFVEHPPAISGDLYIAGEGFEDELDYLPVWGSRQFSVDGVEAFARWDNLAIFIDKRTAAVRQELHTPNFAKISSMTPVAATE
ncbi:hypothetical protein [Agromyces cerinus]|uniref:Immunity protein 35 n=1 Tax=Agromyces cerinus subsp. cerinus TaxID=232089 RepID=A0A1N6FD21_9MICO|nr:hypothetical protein [Agromyces cerinus]SIN93168.1 hypothetical protein SAMN05443544_1945 [Agromyces cerinus subsp. cerinus]